MDKREHNQRSGGGQEGPGGSASDEGSFDSRLELARSRHGLDRVADAAPGPADRSALSLVTRVGVELVSSLAVGVVIGWALDHWLHTRPLFLVLFVTLGGVAGIYNVWRLVAPTKAATRPPD